MAVGISHRGETVVNKLYKHTRKIGFGLRNTPISGKIRRDIHCIGSLKTHAGERVCTFEHTFLDYT